MGPLDCLSLKVLLNLIKNLQGVYEVIDVVPVAYTYGTPLFQIM